MPISVTCSCGRSYQKPEHKAGELFRCHACGREVVIREGVDGGITPREPDAGRPGIPPREKGRRRNRVSVGHSYPALWLGTAFLACLAGCTGFGGVMASIMPAPAARGNPPPIWVFIIPVAFFGSLAALLGWFAARMSERFEADDAGITWRNRGRDRVSFAWGDLRYARLEGMGLTLAGPPDTPVLQISTNYKGFDSLLKLVQQSVDWEALVRAQATPEVEVPQPQPQQTLELPVVRNRSLPFWIAVFAATGLAVLTVAGWRLALRPAPPVARGPANQRPAEPSDKIGEYAFLAGVWVVLPALVVACCVGAFRCWTRFTVNEEGIEFQYFLRKRRYAWDELRAVRVKLVMTEVTHNGGKNRSYRHVLRITTADDDHLNLGFAEACFFFRDAIVAAAARAGVALRHD